MSRKPRTGRPGRVPAVTRAREYTDITKTRGGNSQASLTGSTDGVPVLWGVIYAVAVEGSGIPKRESPVVAGPDFPDQRFSVLRERPNDSGWRWDRCRFVDT